MLTRAAGPCSPSAMLTSAPVLAQTPIPKLEFEVASVRPSSKSMGEAAPVALGLRLDGSQARIGALTLRDYIAMAYRIKSYQVIGRRLDFDSIGSMSTPSCPKAPPSIRSPR